DDAPALMVTGPETAAVQPPSVKSWKTGAPTVLERPTRRSDAPATGNPLLSWTCTVTAALHASTAAARDRVVKRSRAGPLLTATEALPASSGGEDAVTLAVPEASPWR